MGKKWWGLWWNTGGNDDLYHEDAWFVCKSDPNAPITTTTEPELTTTTTTLEPTTTTEATLEPTTTTEGTTPNIPAPIDGQDVFIQGTWNHLTGDQELYPGGYPVGYKRMTTVISNKEQCDLAARSLAEKSLGDKLNNPSSARAEHEQYQPNGCHLYSYTDSVRGTCYTLYWNTFSTAQQRTANKVMCVLEAWTPSGPTAPSDGVRRLMASNVLPKN